MSTVIEPNAAEAGAAAAQAPAKAIIKIEGAEVPLLEKWAANDDLLKKALRNRYTMINNATITRKRDEKGVLIVTVVKRADFKGRRARARSGAGALTPHQRVIAAARSVTPWTNPALTLARALQLRSGRGKLTPTAVARLRPQIEAAVKEGEKEHERTKKAFERAKQCRPTPTGEAPVGF